MYPPVYGNRRIWSVITREQSDHVVLHLMTIDFEMVYGYFCTPPNPESLLWELDIVYNKRNTEQWTCAALLTAANRLVDKTLAVMEQD